MRMIQKSLPKTIRYYLLPTALFFALVAANVYMYQQSPRNGESPGDVAKADTKPLASSLPMDLLTLESVKGLAAKEAPGAPITKIELQSKDKQLIYIVSLANSVRLTFDAQTGIRLPNFVAGNVLGQTVLPVDFAPTVDFSHAQEIALAQKPDGVVSRIELEKQGDDVLYSVVFTDDAAVKISADDGKVLGAVSGQPTSPDPGASPSNTTPTEPVPPTDTPPENNSGTDTQSNELLQPVVNEVL